MTTIKDPSIFVIRRAAIDTSGRLGSLYDGYRDRIVGPSNVDDQGLSYSSKKDGQCTLKFVNQKQIHNLLQFTTLQDPLRLNVLLQLTQKTEITSLIDYPYTTDKYIRILHYLYNNRTEELPENNEHARECIKLFTPQTDVTHIITGVTWGIDAYIVLQLPHEFKTARQIDNVLKKLTFFLNNDDNTLELTAEEENLLDKIIDVKFYSNIPKPNTSTVRDICHYIIKSKDDTIEHPIWYSLRPIIWLHPNYVETAATFLFFSISLNNNIERYILQLRSMLNTLETFIKENLSILQRENLQEKLQSVQTQYSDLKQKCMNEIEQFSKLVLNARKSEADKAILIQALDNDKPTTLKNSIDDLIQNTKEHLNGVNSQPAKQNEIINILLLGESGVGKSTFINAFVNYLSFDTLQQAQSNKPVVIIPVSFIMAIGDNFEERTIKFGDFDSLSNEDFNNIGHSVTQHCKSYVFRLRDGKKLRIIDTPGFGDTRGLEQDDHNMQRILKYINNLTHLNAICFLAKPNVSRLHIIFRSCFTQLIDFLGPNACKNLTFCFTNARSTFYSPGNTAPLLKKMIKSFSIQDIPFNKENTFCFDSESFRYLVALQNGINFKDEEKKDYEMSWTTSVKQSNRLIEYITSRLTEFHIESERKSIKHAQFEIIYMIRPILETMRNILRNRVLWNMGFPNKSVELCPKSIHRPSTLCLKCKKYIQNGNFLITEDYPHELETTCLDCSCAIDYHISIDYKLEYKFVSSDSNHQTTDTDEQLTLLSQASAEFIYFLMNIACCTKDNKFLISLQQMIEEEEDNCTKIKPNDLNSHLVKYLYELKQKYEQQMNERISNQDCNNLTVVYEWIEKVSRIHMVQEQITAIRNGQKIMMEDYEYQYQATS